LIPSPKPGRFAVTGFFSSHYRFVTETSFMKPTQIIPDLFPPKTLRGGSLSTFYVLCPCCESRVDAFPVGSDPKSTPARSMAVCELCEMSFDYTDKDVRQTEDGQTG
jgi:hypothetical protein